LRKDIFWREQKLDQVRWTLHPALSLQRTQSQKHILVFALCVQFRFEYPATVSPCQFSSANFIGRVVLSIFHYTIKILFL